MIIVQTNAPVIVPINTNNMSSPFRHVYVGSIYSNRCKIDTIYAIQAVKAEISSIKWGVIVLTFKQNHALIIQNRYR
jgi:hypothetical protein